MSEDEVYRTGGKGASLHRLSSAGLPVPLWTAVAVDAFAAFVVAHDLEGMIGELADTEDLEHALALAADLRAGIAEAEFPSSVRASVLGAYESVGGGSVAVRSSGVAEDGSEFSHAGQFDSFLNVLGEEDVLDCVRRCWVSAYSDRSVRYLLSSGTTVSASGIAVVIQQFVPARASGVMFTANPITGARDEIVISSVLGLGEGLVSGAVDADSVVVNKDTGVFGDRIVGEKEQQYVADGDHGLAPIVVPDELRSRPAITDHEVGRLVEVGNRIEEIYGAPQDIEWLLGGDDIWIVQSRPVTTLGEPPVSARLPGVQLQGADEDVPAGELRIWDNSNIIESFSGISSPLTFTTASDVYGRVYLSYAKSLRVPKAQLKQMQSWNPVMLGYFHGRVYYNLLHWYRMVGIAPGYPLNRRVLEVALGVDEPLDDATAKTLKPFTFDSLPARVVSRAVTTATYIKRFFEIDKKTDRFMRGFYRVYDKYDAIDYDALTGDEVYKRYRRMERDLVDRWGPMMVLDAILLTSSGLLYLLTKAFLPNAPEWFTYAVVSPGSDVESAEPARAMSLMAEHVRADPKLLDFVNTTDPATAYEKLKSSEWTEFAAEVDAYIDSYGYRSLDELKLEAPDLREDPSSLFVMLRSALPEGPMSKRADADDYLDEHLGGIRRRAYEKLRSKTSRSLANRERLRFCRTRAFGMVKRMLRALGRDLVRRDVLDEFSDVFYLRLDELRGCYEGATDTETLRDLVAGRKAQKSRDSLLVAPPRFVTEGVDFSVDALEKQGWIPLEATEAAESGAVLEGTPSASGIVEGRAVVVDEPRDVAGGILIAYRTDPGWVAALPSASALVIERGSPLTHVAIIARELGVPTVVQVKDVTKLVRTGMNLRVDGARGVVVVLSDGTGRDAE
ncbi:phosphoenolpyruvate synthase [Rhodococcus sp. NPDC058521]|uniref:phosphoenolpyruvate synthase n=1 Tax=Rhodococcus sp. NPDC058521 TaxID=3346536 RepID=UPI00365B7B90